MLIWALAYARMSGTVGVSLAQFGWGWWTYVVLKEGIRDGGRIW